MQIEKTAINKKVYNLSTNKGCPANTTDKSKCIGACPVSLDFDFKPERRPEIIIQAKCAGSKHQICSHNEISECTEDIKKIQVSYPKTGKVTKNFKVSVGCYCTSKPSRPANMAATPYSG
jgi:hypothetical protein